MLLRGRSCCFESEMAKAPEIVRNLVGTSCRPGLDLRKISLCLPNRSCSDADGSMSVNIFLHNCNRIDPWFACRPESVLHPTLELCRRLDDGCIWLGGTQWWD